MHCEVRLRPDDLPDGQARQRLALRRLERRLREDADDVQIPRRPDHVDQGAVRPRRVTAHDTRRPRGPEHDANSDHGRLDGVDRHDQRRRLPRLSRRRGGRRHDDDRVRVREPELRPRLQHRGRRCRSRRQSLPAGDPDGDDAAVCAGGARRGRRRHLRGRQRTVVVKLRVNRATTARFRLLRNGGTVVTTRPRVDPGTNALRLRVPAGSPAGVYRLDDRARQPRRRHAHPSRPQRARPAAMSRSSESTPEKPPKPPRKRRAPNRCRPSRGHGRRGARRGRRADRTRPSHRGRASGSRQSARSARSSA